MIKSKQVKSAAAFLRQHIDKKPDLAIILGSGLSQVLDECEIINRIPYSEIPFYPQSTVEGHKGEWILARTGSSYVAFLSGRIHYYEGYEWEDLIFPVQVLSEFGVKSLIISNACGSTNPQYNKGDIVLVRDHINLLPMEVPLKTEPILPKRIYPTSLIEDLYQHHIKQGIPLQIGVYCVLQGPTLETKAEYAWLNRIGADVVGMSSVPEAMEAARSGMIPIMISVVTDVGYPPEKVEYTTHEDVLDIASKASPNVWAIIKNCIDIIVKNK